MDYRKRTCRPRSYNDPGHAHELTFSCFHHYPFLTAERTCTWLADAINSARDELDYSVWAYVFMPDHVHLLVWPRQRLYQVSEFLKRVKEPVSRQAIQFLKRHSPEWMSRICVAHGSRQEHHFWQQGRGYDRNIVDARTLLNAIDYIHMNPCRKGLVEAPVNWRWSSAGWFVGAPRNDLRPDPIPFDWLEDQ